MNLVLNLIMKRRGRPTNKPKYDDDYEEDELELEEENENELEEENENESEEQSHFEMLNELMSFKAEESARRSSVHFAAAQNCLSLAQSSLHAANQEKINLQNYIQNAEIMAENFANLAINADQWISQESTQSLQNLLSEAQAASNFAVAQATAAQASAQAAQLAADSSYQQVQNIQQSAEEDQALINFVVNNAQAAQNIAQAAQNIAQNVQNISTQIQQIANEFSEFINNQIENAEIEE
jgi:hypothetical protein